MRASPQTPEVGVSSKEVGGFVEGKWEKVILAASNLVRVSWCFEGQLVTGFEAQWDENSR